MTTLYVTAGAARGDGLGTNNDFSNAKSWSNIITVISSNLASAPTSNTLYLEAGLSYAVPTTKINVNKKINWIGRYPNGTDGYAILQSNRTWPWPRNGIWTNNGQYTAANEGFAPFALKTNGGGSSFSWIFWKDCRYGIQTSLDVFSDRVAISFSNCKSFNSTVSYLYTNGNTDGVVDLTFQNCTGSHYSSKGNRTWGSMSQDNCVFNSRNQYHNTSEQAAGFHIQDYIPGTMTTRPTVSVTNSAYLGHSPLFPYDALLTFTVKATGGTFTVSVSAQTTSALAYNISAASLQTAIEGLSSVGPGNCTVTGGPGDATGTTPYRVGFIGLSAQANVTSADANPASLTGTKKADFTPSGYPQGDGFVLEETISAATITDVYVTGAVDRGIDLKSTAEITRFFTRDCGFDISNHNDGVDVNVYNSYLGTPSRYNAETSAVANLQAAGRLNVYNSVVDILPTDISPPADRGLFNLIRGEVNDIGMQSSMIVPLRVGKITQTNCIDRRASTITESLLPPNSADDGIGLAIFGLTPSSSYSYIICAVNASGIEGAASSPLTVNTAAAFTAGDVPGIAGGATPFAPGQPVATNVTSTSVDLSWSPASDNIAIFAYVIYVNGVVCRFMHNTSTSINNLVPDTNYSIRVAAYDFSNNISSLSAACPITTAHLPAVTSPALSTANTPTLSDAGPNWAFLDWTVTAGSLNATNAVGFRVYTNTATPMLVAQTFKGNIVTPTSNKTRVTSIVGYPPMYPDVTTIPSVYTHS